MSAPSDLSITLYSNPGCPYVHRTLITLHELNIPFTPSFIDLNTPRPESYLKINPRGTVPALTFTSPSFNNGKQVIVNESLIIVHFLTDLFPNHLIPSPGSLEGAAERARILFVIDTWGNKVGTAFIKAALASVGEEVAAKEAVDTAVAAVEKEIDPLFAKLEGDGDGPFLGGRDRFTLAEVAIAPFILRNFSQSSNGILSPTFKEKLLALPNFGKWATAVLKNESLLKDWDEPTFLEGTRKKLQQFKDGTFKPKV
ncbi:hypothetical protein TWF225_003110 [Orbilia oligospora]|uniref:Uncharacterized protein n=1 Tax=Orbilia oligospora TaxID=2813651 RepID=A0A7C8P127_ORBOL|nr:hypothetical protein TWF751_003224 [Orbilia oligospora]KAF3161152.1 hypothetical protein TWF225_003110 [Orbilia oligospora]KAF3232747.1 hypothetical protein TWF128_003712 [Orbilia oligospora]KAF3235065.1 hypothetical protein TWF217_003363 [Orbilia oligospora]KAF3298386.1 hypothetical protein TWF132_000208 [Orbilia oligospora]